MTNGFLELAMILYVAAISILHGLYGLNLPIRQRLTTFSINEQQARLNMSFTIGKPGIAFLAPVRLAG
jgi:hypothetical protein